MPTHGPLPISEPSSEPELIEFPASGITFGALSWGPSDGPLALCLHGYPDTAFTWRHLGPRLAADGWRVVAPYMRGYAPSDLAPDGSYSVGALGRDALAAHAALQGDERAVLIGHDWGAVATYAALAEDPTRFQRAVTLAVPPLPVLFAALRSPASLLRQLPLVGSQLRRSWYTLFQQLPVVSERSLDALIPRLWSDWSPGYDATEDVRRVFEALDSAERRSAALRPYRAFLQPWYRSGSYAAEQAVAFSVPALPLLYLHGDRDGCVLSAFAERAREVLPAPARVEIVAGAGHFLQLERPDHVGESIAAFVAG